MCGSTPSSTLSTLEPPCPPFFLHRHSSIHHRHSVVRGDRGRSDECGARRSDRRHLADGQVRNPLCVCTHRDVRTIYASFPVNDVHTNGNLVGECRAIFFCFFSSSSRNTRENGAFVPRLFMYLCICCCLFCLTIPLQQSARGRERRAVEKDARLSRERLLAGRGHAGRL